MWCAVTCSARRGIANSCYNFVVSVTQDHRAPRAHLIYVGLVVNAGDCCPFGLLNEARSATDGAKSADRRINSTGHYFERPLEKLLGMVLRCFWETHVYEDSNGRG